MKIIVIGSISSGMTLAERLAAEEREAAITLYERGTFCSCGTGGLPHYLGLKAEELGEVLSGCALSVRNGQIRTQREVTAIDAARRTVTVRDVETGETETDHYDKLVLATGSRPRPLAVEGAGRMGVHALSRVEELMLLRQFLRSPYIRDITVLGGSLAALETAGAFRALGREVQVIDCGEVLLPGFDGEVRSAIQRALEDRGVRFRLGERVTEVEGRTFLEALRTDRGRYPCDLCVPCLGAVPETGLLPEAARDPEGRYLVDQDGRTSLPEVYAVGSCASLEEGGEPTVSASIAGLEAARTGLTQEGAAQRGLHPMSAMATGQDRTGLVPNAGAVTVKLIYEGASRRVLGAQIWGGADSAARINAIAVAVQAGMTVEELAKARFVTNTAVHAALDPIQLACAAARA